MTEELQNEPKTIGLSQETKAKLDRLKTDNHFSQMQDAYKFAVGLALASGAISPPLKNTITIFGSGDLDQDRSLYEVVKALRTDKDEPVYKTIERLADWGVQELFAQTEAGSIHFSSILGAVAQAKERIV